MTSQACADGQEEEDEYQSEPDKRWNGLGAQKDQQPKDGQNAYPPHP